MASVPPLPRSRAARAIQVLVPDAPFPVRLALAAGYAFLVGYLLYAAAGVGGPSLDYAVREVAFISIFFMVAGLCLVRAAMHGPDRLAWTLIGAALLLYGGGWVYYSAVTQHLASPPFPSAGDYMWFAFYPLCYAGFLLIVVQRLRGLGKELWLDGLIAALAVAAVAAAFLAGPLGELTGGSSAAIATNLVYPLADIHQFGFIVAVLAVAGWNAGPPWPLLAVAFAAAAAADATFTYEVLHGSYSIGGVLDAGYLVLALAIGSAAWHPRVPLQAVHFHRTSVLAVPAGFVLVAVGLLIYGNFGELTRTAEILVTATFIGGAVRTAGAFRRIQQLEGLAQTDRLTGLLNHGEFHAVLKRWIETPREEADRFALVMFDIDGFKAVNDARGHAEGDRVLKQVARTLAALKRPDDVAARVGGDEFALILASAGFEEAEIVGARIARAVEALGEGVGLSFGIACWPPDGPTREMLLLRADVALYEAKGSGARPAPESEPQTRGIRRGDRDDAASARRGADAADYLNPAANAQLRAYAQDVRRSYALGLQRARKLEESYLATVTALATAVEAKDDYTGGHIQRVEALGLILAREAAPGEVDDPQMAYGFLLHDIGKMSVPDAVLTKPAKLDQEEWALMRAHPAEGVRILNGAPFLDKALDVVHHHHERWDGAGYPDGLAGEAIPLWARIFSIVDTVDAITSSRPYRGGRPLSVAVEELVKGSGSQFDPACVEAFLRIPPGEIESVIEWDPASEPRPAGLATTLAGGR